MTEKELRQKIVQQAQSWVGRKEADGTHRVIIDVYNSIDPLPRSYRMTYYDPWCAAFVSACAQVWGLTGIVFPECACDPMIAKYKSAERWVENDAYTPQSGDVIFYDWQDNGYGDNTGSSDHVGLVVGVSGNVINIIEGNCSDMVMYTSRQINGRYIRGYGVPDYAAAASAINAHEDRSDEPPTAVVIPEEPVPSPDTPTLAVTMPAPPAGCTYVALPTLQIGDESEAVRAAQLLLKGRGFSVGLAGCDGEFGRKTESAVGKFQRDREIECDGIIGPETWGKLICN